MNKQLQKQIVKEIEALTRTVSFALPVKRNNKYLHLTVQDIRDLYDLYHTLLSGNIDNAVRMFNGLDTTSIPDRIWAYLDKMDLKINDYGEYAQGK
jgi:hypothetical protein